MKFIKIWSLLLGISCTINWSVAQEVQTEFKNQKKSTISWGSIPTESFLSFKEWKETSDLKDLYPEWEKVIAERNLREKVGNVFQCAGICRIDRGESFFNASHRTTLYEGDEFQTIGDSYAWIFLLDGTMVRLSPHSSITISELNVSKEQFFIHARLNAGNILWLSRSESQFEELNIRETDVLFFPLKLYEAMPVVEKKPYLEDFLIELIDEKNTRINQYKALNTEIVKNNSMTKNKTTFSFLVMPNGTLMGNSVNVEAVVLIGSRSYIKNRSSKFLGHQTAVDENLSLQLRGFENKELSVVNADTWMFIDEKGRTLGIVDDTYWLTMGEFITRRIPSLMLGRELFLQQYSGFLFDPASTPLVLARDYGYRTWSKEEIDQRLQFLKEYFRRIETSNLLTSSNFRQRLENRGDTAGARGQIMEFGNHFFIKALNRYYTFEDDPETKEYNPDREQLNSTQKLLWKKMNGIR